jgi:hypothetical protein
MTPHEIAAMSTAVTLVFGGGLGIALATITIGAAAAAEYLIDRFRP